MLFALAGDVLAIFVIVFIVTAVIAVVGERRRRVSTESVEDET
jgi:hypothetical protein